MTGTSSGPEPRWTPAATLESIKPGGVKLLRVGREQVALFRLMDGRIFAVDNRCPHEGYPLSQGAVNGEVLTCTWHNYKFDLKDGACLLGDEAVRAYAVRVVDGVVEVDLSPPDPSAVVPKLWRSLEEGLRDNEVGRMARDVARLLQSGVDPVAVAAFGARWDATVSEYGTTHGLPVAADTVAVLGRFPGMSATLPLVQALEIAARPHIRRPPRPSPEPTDPGEDPVAAGARLRALVEAEELEPAEALLRGAIAKGWGREVIEPWLYRLCADHKLDFGHALIYQVKVFDLLEAAGWEHADLLLRAHLASIALGTREDLLPPWAGTRKRLSIVAPELPALLAMPRVAGPGWANATDEGPRALYASLLDGGPAGAFSALRDALRQGAPLDRIADALVLAASARMMRFDLRIEATVDNQNSWLDVTHLLTFSSAARTALRRYHEPDVLKLLFQAAHFIERAGALDGPVNKAPLRSGAAVDDVLAAIAAGDVDGAVGATAGVLESGGREALYDALIRLSFDDPSVRAIFVAHVLKTTVAAFAELEATGSALPVLALVRFLAAPKRERRVTRAVHDALQLVVEGKIPRDLTASSGGHRAEGTAQESRLADDF